MQSTPVTPVIETDREKVGNYPSPQDFYTLYIYPITAPFYILLNIYIYRLTSTLIHLPLPTLTPTLSLKWGKTVTVTMASHLFHL